jgi:hypothetical protein
MVVPWTDATLTPPFVVTCSGGIGQGKRLRRVPHRREKCSVADARAVVPTAMGKWPRVLPAGSCSVQVPASSDQAMESGIGRTDAATSSAAAAAFTVRA